MGFWLVFLSLQLYEIYRKDKVSEFWQGIRAPDQSTSASVADDDDASVTEMDRRYDSLIDEKDEDGGWIVTLIVYCNKKRIDSSDCDQETFGR